VGVERRVVKRPLVVTRNLVAEEAGVAVEQVWLGLLVVVQYSRLVVVVEGEVAVLSKMVLVVVLGAPTLRAGVVRQV
jgi:hypothetical protein